MVSVAINHVSVLATDIEESTEFYCDVLGMERIPSPNFEVPVQWLQTRSGQVHLFERDIDVAEYYHFGVTVDDFEAVYERAVADDLFANWDDSVDGRIYRLPDDAAQLYISDPAGNLVEVDYPDIEALDEWMLEDVVDRSEVEDQRGEAADGTLNISKLDSDSDA